MKFTACVLMTELKLYAIVLKISSLVTIMECTFTQFYLFLNLTLLMPCAFPYGLPLC